MYYDFVDFQCDVIDYDSYSHLFDVVMKPEYRGEAENFLVEAMEEDDCLLESSDFYVYVDADKTMLNCNLRFYFENRTLEEDAMKDDIPRIELKFRGGAVV